MLVRAVVLVILGSSAMMPIGFAGVLKCVDAEGNVYFSDVSCPASTEREVIDVYKSNVSESPAATGAGSGYSVMEQAAQMEANRVRQRQSAIAARAAVRPTSQSRSPSTADIDRRLAELEKEEASVRDDASGNPSSIRRRWIREDLATIEAERSELLKIKDALLGRPGYTASQESLRAAERRQRSLEAASRAEEENDLRIAEKKQEWQERQENIDQIRRTYDREKRLQEIGVMGREGQFRRAGKACKSTPGAFCD